MAKVKNWMIDQDETARDILDDLIDEIDNAGAVLASTVDCTTQRGNVCGFRDFNIGVALAVRRAKQMLNP